MSTENLTNGSVRAMSEALKALGNRRMASATADAKVGRLLRFIQQHSDPIIEARTRIAADVLEAIGDFSKLSPLEQQALLVRISAAQTAFDNEVVVIENFPTLRLTEDEMPREKPGDEGWKNAAQLGCIMADLGILLDFKDSE